MTTNSIDEASGFSSKMALCLAAITIVGIDGEFKEEELDKLRGLIRTDETAFLKAFNFYNDRPIEVCLKVVTARLNNDQKKITYQILYDLAHSDKDFADSEEKLLQQYAAEFELSKDFIGSVNDNVNQKYDLTVFE
jgi:uncharacterized tellurite resistance protein B-like protein